MNTFRNVLLFDRGQCHDRKCQDIDYDRRDTRQDLLHSGAPLRHDVLLTTNTMGCAEVEQVARKYFQRIVQEDLPPAIFCVLAELKRQIDGCDDE